MDTRTGDIYEGLSAEEIKKRGLVAVSLLVADAVEIGLEALNRAERRLAARKGRRVQKHLRRG